MAIGMVGCVAHAQPGWFTVVGDPLDKMADTVQVDPDKVAPVETLKEMNLRVNRSTPRFNWDGIPTAPTSRAWCSIASRAAPATWPRASIQPLWQGESHHVADYSEAPKPVAFRDMKPNPTARIVRAACRVRSS
jgi:hypothetical protein